METINIIKKPTAKLRLLSNTLIVFVVAMVLANIAAEMYMTMLPHYLRILRRDGMQIWISCLLAPAVGSFIGKTISPQAPFYIKAVFTLITAILVGLKFNLDVGDLERAAQVHGN